MRPERLRALSSASAQARLPLTADARTYSVAGRTASVGIRGALTPRSSLLGLLGLESNYGDVAAAVALADADDSVDSIRLDISSPGGLVEGAASAAEAIARAVKPVTAYVEGECCSAAYWLASAADRIVASPTAEVGCLGVCVSVVDYSDALAAEGIRRVDFVSSQTPRKLADPTTDEAAASDLQANVDDKAAVFLGAVARYRGLADADEVARRYGGGATMSAQRALDAGLIDAIALTAPLGALDNTPASCRDGGPMDRDRSARAEAGETTEAGDAIDAILPAEAEEMEVEVEEGPTVDELLAKIASLEEELRQATEGEVEEAAALRRRVADLEDERRIERAQASGKLETNPDAVKRARAFLANDRAHGSTFFAAEVEARSPGSLVPVGQRLSHGASVDAGDEVGDLRRSLHEAAKANGTNFAAELRALRHKNPERARLLEQEATR